MPRVKASVQLYDAAMRNPPPISLQGADADGAGGAACAGEGIRESQLSAQIVGQLRLAYDELLNAPIPDHLQKLLTELLDQEGKS